MRIKKRKQELKIYHAHSMNNGIIFYSKCHKGYVAVATIDEQENITTEWTTIKSFKNKSEQYKNDNIKETLSLIFHMLPFVIIFCVLLNLAKNKSPIYFLRTFYIGNIFMELDSFVRTLRNIKKREAYMFHSAEHMLLNAYQKLKRVPNLEEIQQYSRFDNYCGTNDTAQCVITCGLFFACTFIPNFMCQLLIIPFVFIFVLILNQLGLLNFLQIFTTLPPTTRELTVAIEGMKVWLENEQKERENSQIP